MTCYYCGHTKLRLEGNETCSLNCPDRTGDTAAMARWQQGKLDGRTGKARATDELVYMMGYLQGVAAAEEAENSDQPVLA